MSASVFPARAGMNPRRLPPHLCYPRVPRASGDEPPNKPKSRQVEKVFPARAGMNHKEASKSMRGSVCSPRERG